ncbi:MAG: isoleucine--tRNA ligase, partial [Bryobacteraceae bacterium]
ALIWTTTPWTIPANLAICFNPRFEYVAVATPQRMDTPEGIAIVAEGLLPQVEEALGWGRTIVARFPGTRLENALFRHPFIERDSVGLLADHVTLDQGTGAVHTAPGHGQEDFVICRRYGIPVYCPVDAAGRFFYAEGATGSLPDELLGKTVWQANPIVIRLLEERGALAGQARVEHSYPHCWRCHNPVIFRATEQWFIGMDRQELRQRALEAIKNVKWYPAWGEERISNMVSTRPDWCISRQRVWGVPIIVFYCEQCGQPFTEKHALDNVVAQFREHSSDVWFTKSAAELMGPGCACRKCGGTEFRKENDILDVWFDSGSSHLAVLTEENDLPWPAGMYLEGGDQYRGWFQSSLLIAVALKEGAPYLQTATHGWTLDADGRAMSKSSNSVGPEKVVKRYGADILRLWAASVDFMEDVRISDTILERLAEAYRKMRNTFKYMLGNLGDFDPAKDGIRADRLTGIDAWILVRAENLALRCAAFYHEYAFHKVYRAIYDFATTDLSATYFDILKDRLYTSAPASHGRRSAQTALHRLNLALVRLLAPILSFTCEEVWRHTKPRVLAGGAGSVQGAAESIHMEYFPKPEDLTAGLTSAQREDAADWDRLLEVRAAVSKAINDLRDRKVIGASLDAAVSLHAGGETYELLEKHAADLPAWFIVSQVELQNPDREGGGLVHVDRARGDKCERCWKYTMDVGSNPEFPTVCAACAAVLPEFLELSRV